MLSLTTRPQGASGRMGYPWLHAQWPLRPLLYASLARGVAGAEREQGSLIPREHVDAAPTVCYKPSLARMRLAQACATPFAGCSLPGMVAQPSHQSPSNGPPQHGFHHFPRHASPLFNHRILLVLLGLLPCERRQEHLQNPPSIHGKLSHLHNETGVTSDLAVGYALPAVWLDSQ